MLKCIFRAAHGHGYANIARDQREHVRGPFHEFLDISNTAQRTLDHALVFAGKARLAGDLFDIITICFNAGHAPRRGVWLVKIASIGKIGHHVADGRRTQALSVRPRKGARADRLPRGNKRLHDGGQDFPLSISDGRSW